MDHLVSIIVCCYNGSPYIDSCFHHLLEQEYSHFEVLFVDDGSDDSSFQNALCYVDSFREKGSRLLCFSQTNKGVGAAASLGLSQSSGEFICCYDIDDELFSGAIHEMVSFLVTHPTYDIVRTNGYRENENGVVSLFVESETEKQKSDIFEDILFGKTNNWSGSYMIRSAALWEVFPSHTIIESRYGQNLQLLLSASYRRLAGFIDKPLMKYRYNPSSFTNSGDDYDTRIDKILGYKSIRLSVIDHLQIKSEHYQNKLDIYYLKMILDIDLNYHRTKEFVSHFHQLRKLTGPDCIYSYHYYRIINRPVLALLYKMLFNCCRLVGLNS